jgi:2-keto-3-deoxy-L-rhamnonate aldolase RhmA
MPDSGPRPDDGVLNRPPTLKAKLAGGEPIIGIMVFEFITPGLAELAADAGLDYIIFDAEASPMSWETMRVCALACHAAGVAPLVRLGSIRADTVGRALDLGMVGIMAPKIVSREDAEALVRYARFPPDGVRSSGHSIGLRSIKHLPVAEQMRFANQSTFLICQIESPEAVASASEIASVTGVDAISVGVNDLTAAMGIPGEFDDPRFQNARRRVREAAVEQGKHFAGTVSDPARLVEAVADGLTVVMVPHDRELIRTAMRRYPDALERTTERQPRS